MPLHMVKADLDSGALVKIRVQGVPRAAAVVERSLPEGPATGARGPSLHRGTQAEVSYDYMMNDHAICSVYKSITIAGQSGGRFFMGFSLITLGAFRPRPAPLLHRHDPDRKRRDP